MSSLLVCSTPVHGHILPLLRVAEELVRNGHRVRFLTGSRYRERVEETGVRWLPLSPEADYDDRDMDAAFPGRRGRTGVAGIRWDLREIFLKPAPAQLADIDAALAAEPAEAVLAESLFAGAMLLLARPGPRPAVVNLGIVPLGVRSRDTAPFGLGIPPLPGPLGRARNRALGLMTDRVVFGSLNRYARRLIARTAGEADPRDSFFRWPERADALVQFTVPEFEYPRPDLPATVHFVGPIRSACAPGEGLPPWWPELDAARPLVHVTQGTVATGDPGALIGPALEALAGEDVDVVVTTGGGELPPRDLPPNVRTAGYIPHELLMPRVDVFVTNGGYGGVHSALAHGVPLVACGRTEEKAEVLARVAWSGAGVVLRADRPDPRRLREAVHRVLADPSYRRRSAAIGEAIAAAPGPAGLEAVLRTLLHSAPAAAEAPAPKEPAMTATQPRIGSAGLVTLRDRLSGALLLPGDRGWEEAAAPWNLSIAARPSAVVCAADAEDVALAVRHAREAGLRVSLQGPGHGATEALAGSLMVRTAALDGIEVRAEERIAVVGAGVSAAMLQERLEGTGLTGPVGSSGSVSVAGLVLQGGYPWLARLHGSAAGALRGAEIVRADGTRAWVGEEGAPGTLWALRGGGGRVAAVTAVEIQLQIAGELTGGKLLFPLEAAPAVLGAYAGATASCPPETTLWAGLAHFPPLPELPEVVRGRSFAFVDAVSTAGPEALERALAPLRAAGPVLHDTVAARTPAQLLEVCEEPLRPMPAVQRGIGLRCFTAETAAALLDAAGAPGRFLQVQVRHLGGAPDRGNGVGSRIGAEYVVNPLAVAPVPEAGRAARAAMESLAAALAPWAGAPLLPSFVAPWRTLTDCYEEDARERLGRVARQHDPEGIFTGFLPIG
jgi:UDP:flavonoid glycosyltransferase YjiC (YdhE family)/FAD/FMN-containing dehydrogenase